MMNMSHLLTKKQGFTLVEVIVAIIIIAIGASLVLTMNRTGIVSGRSPLSRLTDNLAVQQAVEIVDADYRQRLEINPDTDITIYARDDLSSIVSGLAPGLVKGELTSFSAPDAQRTVSELSVTGTDYVRITAQKNDSKLVTLIGN